VGVFRVLIFYGRALPGETRVLGGVVIFLHQLNLSAHSSRTGALGVIGLSDRAMKLKTRVFELCNGRYQSLSELARTMGISNDLIYSVRRGDRGIHQKFIIGATKDFPGYKLDDLFYVSED